MSKHDPRVDDYIAKSADFAKPVLNRIRKLVHAACPDVVEAMKWRMPIYEHKGILICTPAFKKHCAVIFWKGKLLFKEFPAKDNPREKFRRISSNDDLPGDKILTGYIKQAVALNEAGVKTPRHQTKAKAKLVMPDFFLAALKKNKKALATFENFSASCRREYVEWIVEATREATRAKRIETAVEWIAKGKSRNWKYL
jgi:uncharacterized protein YdeI (YjbR/CyaY-like superfamily)